MRRNARVILVASGWSVLIGAASGGAARPPSLALPAVARVRAFGRLGPAGRPHVIVHRADSKASHKTFRPAPLSAASMLRAGPPGAPSIAASAQCVENLPRRSDAMKRRNVFWSTCLARRERDARRETRRPRAPHRQSCGVLANSRSARRPRSIAVAAARASGTRRCAGAAARRAPAGAGDAERAMPTAVRRSLRPRPLWEQERATTALPGIRRPIACGEARHPSGVRSSSARCSGTVKGCFGSGRMMPASSGGALALVVQRRAGCSSAILDRGSRATEICSSASTTSPPPTGRQLAQPGHCDAQALAPRPSRPEDARLVRWAACYAIFARGPHTLARDSSPRAFAALAPAHRTMHRATPALPPRDALRASRDAASGVERALLGRLRAARRDAAQGYDAGDPTTPSGRCFA